MPPPTSAPILVVQGPEATPLRATALAELARAATAEQIGDGAWRLRGAKRHDRIGAWCDAHRLDHAWVPEDRRLADLRLVAMDMDSTLITIECIDELGAFANRKDEISAITAQAMRGEIDYPESLRQRVALLAGLSEDVLQDVYD